MPVQVRYYTDPACSSSWAFEPSLRRLMVEFGADLSFTYVMGGLAREYDAAAHAWLLRHWLDRAGRSPMPIDPRLWTEAPISSTYPACMAVKAAAEQGPRAAEVMLRALREGLLCRRRKLDTTEALVEEARGAGLGAARYRVDLGSHATVEAFGADLEETRELPEEARAGGHVSDAWGSRERLVFPSASFAGEDGTRHWAFGGEDLSAWRSAAEAAGATASGGDLGIEEALGRFGRLATAELGALSGLPGPRLHAELWRLASEWRLKPTRVLTGWLWERA
jgi:predicted DsbA family dithiol-disulfide isomerase